MLSRTIQATRSNAVRAVRQHAQPSAARSLTTTATRQADPIQDMYLKHIRDYKPTPVKPGDADEHVQKFKAPGGFKSPEETNLASELSAYESQTVDTEGAAEPTKAGGAPAEQHVDWFEEEEDFAAEEKAAEGGH